MDSRRVRYLFFLIMLVVAAQTVVYYALAERSIPDPREGRQADLASLPIAAAMLSTPTGPPANRSITANNNLRSMMSKPC